VSQLDSTNEPVGIYEERPRSNIYTAMLGVAFVAMAFASAMLAMELKEYQWDWKAEDAPKAPPPVTGS
jgi:hypothetical protein